MDLFLLYGVYWGSNLGEKGINTAIWLLGNMQIMENNKHLNYRKV